MYTVGLVNGGSDSRLYFWRAARPGKKVPTWEGNGVKFCLVYVMSLAPPCRSGDRCGWAGSYDVSSGEGCPGLGNLEG